MHDNHLTHTDLKPENILFTNSEYDVVYNSRKVSSQLKHKNLWFIAIKVFIIIMDLKIKQPMYF